MELEHHKQLSLCQTRPAYRQGKKLTAVKVYTVSNESQHLFIYGVPKINLRFELKNLLNKFGETTDLHVVSDCKTEAFTECYHVKYLRIQAARIAKRILDNRSFYGNLLHVCYGPEEESVEETFNKLQQRRQDVLKRLNDNEGTHLKPNKRKFIEEKPNKINNKAKRARTFFENHQKRKVVLQEEKPKEIGPKLEPCSSRVVPRFVPRSVQAKRIIFRKTTEQTV